jgi:hypothetical protein
MSLQLDMAVARLAPGGEMEQRGQHFFEKVEIN